MCSGSGPSGFDALSFLGWVVFHGLDIAAVLVLAGCGWFLWRRFRHREATTGQRFGYDFFPDRAGGDLGYRAAADLLELAAGGPQLRPGHRPHGHGGADAVFIPFGKFFHVIQRPASAGVEIYKRSALERDGWPCRRCGQPLEAKAFVNDLKQTMDELELGFRSGPRPAHVASGPARPGIPGHGQEGVQVTEVRYPVVARGGRLPRRRAGTSRPPTGRPPPPRSGWSRPTARSAASSSTPVSPTAG